MEYFHNLVTVFLPYQSQSLDPVVIQDSGVWAGF